MSDRPIEILYVRDDGLAMGETEGSPRQLKKEENSRWRRVCATSEQREEAWKEANKAIKPPPKKITKRRKRKKSS